MLYLWRKQDNLWELVLSSNHVGSKDKTQVVRLAANTCTQPSHLSSPSFNLNSMKDLLENLAKGDFCSGNL